MIGVVCSGKQQFNDFLKSWIKFEDRCKFKCVTRIDDVCGVHFTDVIRVGSYWDLRGHHELYAAAQSRTST